MLVLKRAGLVYLANPKTATQSLRAALEPFAQATPNPVRDKHINAQTYANRWADTITQRLGQAPQTFAVMRAPLEQMGSWYRYRQREALRGHQNSTADITFAEFISARLQDDPPPFAHIGRQDRFLGYLDGGPPVAYVFDYAKLDLLQAFLSERLKTEINLPRHNVSPKAAEAADLALPADLRARLQEAHASEFALYDRVQAVGVLEAA